MKIRPYTFIWGAGEAPYGGVVRLRESSRPSCLRSADKALPRSRPSLPAPPALCVPHCHLRLSELCPHLLFELLSHSSLWYSSHSKQVPLGNTHTDFTPVHPSWVPSRIPRHCPRSLPSLMLTKVLLSSVSVCHTLAAECSVTPAPRA